MCIGPSISATFRQPGYPNVHYFNCIMAGGEKDNISQCIKIEENVRSTPNWRITNDEKWLASYKLNSQVKTLHLRFSFFLLNVEVEAKTVSFPPTHNEEQNYPARRQSIRGLTRQNYTGKKNEFIYNFRRMNVSIRAVYKYKSKPSGLFQR